MNGYEIQQAAVGVAAILLGLGIGVALFRLVLAFARRIERTAGKGLEERVARLEAVVANLREPGGAASG